jgi:hypothetical protein
VDGLDGWTSGSKAPIHAPRRPKAPALAYRQSRRPCAVVLSSVCIQLQPYVILASLLNVLSVRNRAEGDPIKDAQVQHVRRLCPFIIQIRFGCAYHTGNLQTLSHSSTNKNLTEPRNTAVNYRVVHRHYVPALRVRPPSLPPPPYFCSVPYCRPVTNLY